MAKAYGEMARAFSGPVGLLQFMVIEKGTYIDLANANATVVKGMQPNGIRVLKAKPTIVSIPCAMCTR
jgi:hypothetical protein